MQNPPIKADLNSDNEIDEAIFKSQEHFKKEITRFCGGDLYVIGRLWIQALRSVLVGANMSIIPVVEAQKSKKDEKPKKGGLLMPSTPEKPPRMKYEDLPIYESPHYEYKQYVEDNKKCPRQKERLLHNYLYPKVKSYRQSWVDSITEFNKDARELKNDGLSFASKKKDEFICYMRNKENIQLRKAVVAVGTVGGFILGRGEGVVKRLFCSTLGAVGTGSLCFPKETDEIVRDASFKVGKFVLTLVSSACGLKYSLREGLPCPDELPAPPPDPKEKGKKK